MTAVAKPTRLTRCGDPDVIIIKRRLGSTSGPRLLSLGLFNLLVKGGHMRRREFFGLIGGAAAWPFSARAQPQGLRRIGVISAISETDPEAMPRLVAFQQALEHLGWATGRNLRIDFRWHNRGDVA